MILSQGFSLRGRGTVLTGAALCLFTRGSGSIWSTICPCSDSRLLRQPHSYAGDVEINVEIKKYFCKAGVKGVQVEAEVSRCFFLFTHFCCLKKKAHLKPPPCLVLSCLQLYGKLRVILEPLIGDLPLIGAITMFFIRRPVSAMTGCQETFQCFAWCCYNVMHFCWPCRRNWTSTGLDWLIFWIFLAWGEFMC